MFRNKKTPNYLKFISIVIGSMFIIIGLLAAFTNPPETEFDELDKLLQKFNSSPEMITSNLMSYVKKNIVTEPTIFDQSPTLGKSDAPITIFEFSCFSCPASRDIQPILKQVLEKYPDKIKLVWKDLPLPELYPDSEMAHLAARCAQAQNKFWPYQEKLWANQDDFSIDNLKRISQDIGLNKNDFSKCLSDKKLEELINADVSEASQLSISGTPHFYINSQEIFGIATLEDFEKVINAELSR